MNWLTRWIVRRWDRDDPGLRDPSCRFGTKPKNAEKQDYALTLAGWKRAQRRTASGRVLPKPRSKPDAGANVISMPTRARKA